MAVGASIAGPVAGGAVNPARHRTDGRGGGPHERVAVHTSSDRRGCPARCFTTAPWPRPKARVRGILSRRGCFRRKGGGAVWLVVNRKAEAAPEAEPGGHAPLRRSTPDAPSGRPFTKKV